jgi:hypothetical protein
VIDPVINRSPEQLRKRISDARFELAAYGYSVVRTEFLQSLMDREKEHEKADHSQTDCGKDGSPQTGQAEIP